MQKPTSFKKISFFLLLSMLVMPSISLAQPKRQKTPDAAHHEMAISKRCAKFGEGVHASDCLYQEVTKGINGKTCTEKCQIFDSVNNCILKDECHYEASSDCFKNKICSKINKNKVGNCDYWDTILICK